MARSSSQSQSSVGGAEAGAHPTTIGPCSMAAAAVRMRHRRTTTSGKGGGFSGSGKTIMLYYYTDEVPFLRLSPTMLLVMSIWFIGFVSGLHVFDKLYRSRNAAAFV